MTSAQAAHFSNLSATEQLALDEAMLLEADGQHALRSESQTRQEHETSHGHQDTKLGPINREDANPKDSERIRIWSFDRHVVVLGRSSRVGDEVNRPFCEQHGITIERRASGGASVVGGPGCLMYSVVVAHHDKPHLKQIDAAHDYVMSRVLSAVQVQLPEVRRQGICDLTWGDCKFSGNSLRITKHHLLYHGTILYGFDLPLLARCLEFAPRQPDYRNQRSHERFVTNVPLVAERLADDLCQSFGVTGQYDAANYHRRVLDLRQSRYDDDSWRFRH
ncbi:lipoate--protein ligase family protein [Rubripirellula amarantea]|uniref:lipoate--protein ligase family protein n=1 Tax=Rubripirellula amarantea TaxID=2527999 RepID=UPI0011B501B2|nr:lipoate--protein ligase family protein [Rubripirellula amarantea]